MTFILSLFFSSSAVAQVELKAEQLSPEWTLMAEQNGVEFYVRQQGCPFEGSRTGKDADLALIKVVNTNNQTVQITFQVAKLYTEGCDDCEKTEESVKVIAVEGQTVVEGDCSFKNGQLIETISNPNISNSSRTFEGLRLMEFKVK